MHDNYISNFFHSAVMSQKSAILAHTDPSDIEQIVRSLSTGVTSVEHAGSSEVQISARRYLSSFTSQYGAIPILIAHADAEQVRHDVANTVVGAVCDVQMRSRLNFAVADFMRNISAMPSVGAELEYRFANTAKSVRQFDALQATSNDAAVRSTLSTYDVPSPSRAIVIDVMQEAALLPETSVDIYHIGRILSHRKITIGYHANRKMPKISSVMWAVANVAALTHDVDASSRIAELGYYRSADLGMPFMLANIVDATRTVGDQHDYAPRAQFVNEAAAAYMKNDPISRGLCAAGVASYAARQLLGGHVIAENSRKLAAVAKDSFLKMLYLK